MARSSPLLALGLYEDRRAMLKTIKVATDIWATGRYRTHLSEIGMIDVARRGLGWRMWWSGPWLPTRLVTATKPLGWSIGASTPLTVRSPA
jgi:hypothetical protein